MSACPPGAAVQPPPASAFSTGAAGSTAAGTSRWSLFTVVTSVAVLVALAWLVT